MSLGAVLVDKARVVSQTAGQRVEGSTSYSDAPGPWFRARLTVGGSAESGDPTSTGATQNVDTGSLLYKPKVGGAEVGLESSERVEVLSKELGRGTWEVDGDPKPIRKKRRLLGYAAVIHRVDDHST